MATIEELVIKLEADNTKLLSALNESSKVTARSAQQMEDAISKFAQSASKETSRFDKIMNIFAGTTMANVAVMAFQKAMEAAAAMFGQFKDGVGDAIEAEQSVVRLSNALALSGNFSKEAIGGLTAYAEAQEKLTGVSQELIQDNLSLLSSITRLDAEGLKKAQQGALDLSAALGIDLGTATKMVAKAAEGNTDAFRKYGIVIEESTDKAQTLANTVNTLNTRFAGAASGGLKTFGGVAAQLAIGFDDLFEALGDVLVKNPAVIAGIQKITELMRQLTKYVGDNGAVWAKDFAGVIVDSLLVVAAAIEAINKSIGALQGAFIVTVSAIADAGFALKDLLNLDFEKVKNGFQNTSDAIDFMNEKVSGTTAISDALVQVASAAQGASTTMTDSFAEVAPSIENQTNLVRELTAVEKARLAQAAEFGAALVEQSISVQAQYAAQQDALLMMYENDTINFETYKEAKLASQLDQFEREKAMLEASKLNAEEMALARTQLEQNQAIARIKTMDDMRKKEEDINKMRLAGFSSFFGNLSSLQASSQGDLFRLGKAAAVAQATVDGIAAIQGAYKQGSIIGGPILGGVFAAAAGIATAANVAKIQGVALNRGIDAVPGVGNRDTVPAMLTPGERVVPQETNQDLTRFLESQSQKQDRPQVNVNFYGPVWSNKAEAGADIVDAINEALARGMSMPLGAV